MLHGPLHTQAAWDARQSPRLHAVFAQIWDTTRLRVNVAGTNLKPPRSWLHPGWGGSTYMHWDASLAVGDGDPLDPRASGVQAVLYLADTPVNGGGIR